MPAKTTPADPPSAIDITLAKANPWGLNPRQCQMLRFMLQHGSQKAVCYHEGATVRSVDSAMSRVRSKMGFPGPDVRVFLAWRDWVSTWWATTYVSHGAPHA